MYPSCAISLLFSEVMSCPLKALKWSESRVYVDTKLFRPFQCAKKGFVQKGS